ncbi:hypothetical protein GF325_10390 [Candidatus Bathyarchaeota archaeon]|nr:hypothetical protein [Candidatus Bathyarchaeota archaeon]
MADTSTKVLYYLLITCWSMFVIMIFFVEHLLWGCIVGGFSVLGMISLGRIILVDREDRHHR